MSWQRTAASRVILALILLCCCYGATGAVTAPQSEWVRLADRGLGFELAYPASVFQPDTARSREGGHVLVSHDGQARLLAASFENEGLTTLKDYRRQLIEENYPDADIDFAPTRSSWFVLSGTQGQTHFYYRVSFSCGGRLIDSWALIYPVAQRKFYDRIVEAVARTYRPTQTRSGDCG